MIIIKVLIVSFKKQFFQLCTCCEVKNPYQVGIQLCILFSTERSLAWQKVDADKTSKKSEKLKQLQTIF